MADLLARFPACSKRRWVLRSAQKSEKTPQNQPRKENGKLAMSLDIDTVKKVAHLARIRVDEAALESMTGELSSILDWIEQLSELDTEGVEPMASVAAMELPRRADAVTDGNCQAAVLKNAPDAEDGFYTVPKVVE